LTLPETAKRDVLRMMGVGTKDPNWSERANMRTKTHEKLDLQMGNMENNNRSLARDVFYKFN
jgi:hypothetical protein